MTDAEVEQLLASLVERLASIEHDRWSHWQRYLHSKCAAHPDGTLTIPKELVAQWARQSTTPYEELSDAEKNSDREQVQKYLPIIGNALRARPQSEF
ncbi:MAG: hypothetical protein KGJ79_16195 [Alphaproteobacteria bacterium]|nr:hypothetical protein [Alphaproteobacteria bacterium]MDE2494714.1 hypothetical protein [Alphaproteobacteria bacterium]